MCSAARCFIASTERTANGGFALNVEDRLPGGYTLTSITSWRESDWTDHSDETWNGQNLAFSDYTEHSDYGSQELRIASPAKGPRAVFINPAVRSNRSTIASGAGW